MKKLSALSLLGTALLIPTASSAQDETEVPVEESSPVVSFAGFVDTSIVIPIAGYEDDGDEVTFGLDQVELDVTVMPTDGLTIQGDFNYFPAAGMPTMDDLVEQGYLDYTFGGGETGGFIAAGKQNVIFGVESVDPTGLYQYSIAQIPYPSNLTGFFGGYRGDSLTIMGWVSNSFDMPTTPRSATPGLYAGYAFGDHSIGFATTYGPVVADDPYLMFNLDYIGAIGDLTLLAQANVGTSDATTNISGLVTGNYAFSDVVSATLRVDYLTVSSDDETVEYDNLAVTVAGLFNIADNFGAIAEVKTDLPSGGDPMLTGAVELIAWF